MTRNGRPSCSASDSTAMPSPMPNGWLATITNGVSGSSAGGHGAAFRTLTSMSSSMRLNTRSPLGATWRRQKS